MDALSNVNQAPSQVQPGSSWNTVYNTNNEEDEDEIDLSEIFYELGSHIVQILGFLAAGIAAAFVITYFLITPKYTATSKMYILASSSNSAVDLSDLQISTQLRSDYQELITSRPLLEDVIKNLNLDMEPEELEDMMDITNPTDTRIISVAVTTTSPQESADIANEVMNLAKVYLPQIMKTDEPSIFETAEVPDRASSPSYSKNCLIGGLVCALAYIICLIVKYISNDTLVTPDDVNKYLGMQPLATIPEGDLGSFNREKKSKKKGAKKKS